MSNPDELLSQLPALAGEVAARLADDGTVVPGEVVLGTEGVEAAVSQPDYTSAGVPLSGGASGLVVLSLSGASLGTLGENATDALCATATEIIGAWMTSNAPDVQVGVATVMSGPDVSAMAADGASGAAPLTQDGIAIGYISCIYGEAVEGAGGSDAVEFDSFDDTSNIAPINQRSLELLNEVEMGVSVELGRTRMAVKDLLALTPGTVVELDRAAGSPVDLLVNGTMIAKGEVVVIDEEFGVRITEIVGHSTDTPTKAAV